MNEKATKEIQHAINGKNRVMRVSYVELAALDKALNFALKSICLEQQGKKYLSTDRTGKPPVRIEVDQYEIAALKHFLNRIW